MSAPASALDIQVSLVTACHNRSLSWKVCLEFTGKNFQNQSGVSNKFWESWQDSSGRIWVNYGALGTGGLKTPMGPLTLSEATSKIAEKLKKGYGYANYGTLSQISELPLIHKATVPLPTPAQPLARPDLPGPLKDVERVVFISEDRYDALDARGERVMTLNAAGALELFQMSPYVRSKSPSSLLAGP